MTIDNHNDDAQAGATSSTSLRLAAERTELALIRTGFSAAAFGAGMTHMLGRGVWPNSAVDILTIIFVIAGIVSVQVGLNRLQRRMKNTTGSHVSERPGHPLLVTGVYLIQAALVAIILMTLLHSSLTSLK